MFQTKWFATLCFGLIASTLNAAGNSSSGGGSASVCRNGQNEISKAVLVDVLEGRWRQNFSIQESDAPAEQQIKHAIDRLNGDPAVRSFIWQTYEDIRMRMILLPVELGLHVSNDLGNDQAVFIMAGCPLEQVGYYESDGRLRVARSLFNALSPTNQAAFFLHEVLYRLTRAVGATNSATARKGVAALLSSQSDAAVFSLVKKAIYNPAHNVFIPISLKNGEYLKLHTKWEFAIGATVRTFDIQDRLLEEKPITIGEATTELSLKNVARIDFDTGTMEYQLIQLLQSDKIIFQANSIRPLNLGFNIYLGWQQ